MSLPPAVALGQDLPDVRSRQPRRAAIAGIALASAVLGFVAGRLTGPQPAENVASGRRPAQTESAPSSTQAAPSTTPAAQLAALPPATASAAPPPAEPPAEPPAASVAAAVEATAAQNPQPPTPAATTQAAAAAPAPPAARPRTEWTGAATSARVTGASKSSGGAAAETPGPAPGVNPFVQAVQESITEHQVKAK